MNIESENSSCLDRICELLNLNDGWNGGKEKGIRHNPEGVFWLINFCTKLEQNIDSKIFIYPIPSLNGEYISIDVDDATELELNLDKKSVQVFYCKDETELVYEKVIVNNEDDMNEVFSTIKHLLYEYKKEVNGITNG